MNTRIMFKLVYYQYFKLPSTSINISHPVLVLCPCTVLIPGRKFKSFTATARTSIKSSWVGEGARLLSWERVKEGPVTGRPPGSTLHETAGWWERPEEAVSSPERIWVRICVTVASEVEFQIRARFVGCRTRCRTLGRSDSSYAGTCGCRNPAAGLLGGRNSSDAGTRLPRVRQQSSDSGTCCRTLGGRNSPDSGTCCRTLGGWNSSDSGTCCRTLGRPELVGLRNSSMPELAAGLLGGRNSSDAGTRRWIVHFLVLVSLRSTNLSHLTSLSSGQSARLI